jgi:hypothetical protein
MAETTLNPSPQQTSNPANRASDRLRRILIATLFSLIILLAWAELPFEMPYIGTGLVSAFIFQVVVRPRRWEIFGVVAGAAALTLFDRLVTHHATDLRTQIGACLAFLGLVTFLVLGLQAVWAESEERQQLKSILLPAAGFFFFVYWTQHLLNLSAVLFPKTLDVFAYCFDASLGFQPSFMVGRWFRDYAVVDMLGHGFYYGLPIAMALVYGAHLRVKKTTPLFLLEVLMAAGMLGYFLYLAFPAAGPVYLVGPQFPGHPIPFSDLRNLVLRGLEPRRVLMGPATCRNAMPSLHMAWALLIAFNCKPFPRWVRALAYFFVFTTVLGTLGTGEHYVIDLVVAFPFAVAVQALCTRSLPRKARHRLVPLVGGTTLTLLWLILLRFGTRFFFAATPLVPWGCIIVSTALSVLWTKQILSAEQDEPQCSSALARAAAVGA